MATINLGAIKFNWKGAYNNGTTYAVDDVVSSGGNSYVCIQAHSNQAVGNATAYWNIMSSAGSNGTDGTDVGATLANKEIAFKTNAGAVDGIPIGTAGQFLKVNSGATGYEFGAVASGIKQIKFSSAGTTQYSSSSNSYTDVGANYQVTITPTSASNRILIYTQFADQGSGGRTYYNFEKQGDSSGNGDLIANGGWANVENIVGSGNGFTSGMMVDNSIASTNALTYKLRFKNSNSSNTHVNVADSISFMMAMELDGGLF